jgi:thiol:disulfide interchange protein
MRIRPFSQFFVIVFLASGLLAFAAEPNDTTNISNADLVKFTVENQHDKSRSGGRSAIAIHFNVDKNWHFYADKATAPGGVSLQFQFQQQSNVVNFGKPIIPKGQLYEDKFTGTKTEILTGEFTVYVPFTVGLIEPPKAVIPVKKAPVVEPPISVIVKEPIGIKIFGALCSEQQCRMVSLNGETTLTLTSSQQSEAKFTVPTVTQELLTSTGSASPSYSTFAALLLAFVAGIILNIMPCVLPVIPLKVLSIFEQAKESKFRCVTLGLAFCLGILIFFAATAVANIVLRVSYNSVFQWGDHFRNPLFIIGMALLMEVLALIMFGVATVTVPGRVAGATRKQGGYGGSIGMGFLAALLSTPCSFAILTAAFAWAQTQALWLSTIAIMVIGVGMAAPYAILTSMPSLLKHLPKPGRWMEIFKQAMGFVLLVVAVWLLTILPASQQPDVFQYAIILAFCVWMWGTWVRFNSVATTKWGVRVVAILMAVSSGWWLLPAANVANVPQGQIVSEGIVWQPYDAEMIRKAVAQGRPVLIEFTADWCLTCKAVEKTVYARKDIQDLLKAKNVLVVKGDTTWERNPATIALKTVYNEPGVPVTILYVPGKPEPLRLHGMVIGNELKKALEEL